MRTPRGHDGSCPSGYFTSERGVVTRVEVGLCALTLALAGIVQAGTELGEERAASASRLSARPDAKDVVRRTGREAFLGRLAARRAIALRDPFAAFRARALVALRIAVDGCVVRAVV